MFYVDMYNRSFEATAPSQLTLRPKRFSKHAIGGFEYAEFAAYGSELEIREALRWLRNYVIFRNQNHTGVWAGIITEATINLGGISIGISLDDMINRVAVAFTYSDENGNTRGVTDWADDTASQSLYGTIERLESQGDLSQDEAEKLRDQVLDALSKPIKVVSFGAGEVGATLRCRGLWSTLDWKLYNNPAGLIEYTDTGDYDHLLGWSITDTDIGFDAIESRLHDLSGRLEALRAGDIVVISGAAQAGNNDTFAVVKAASADVESYTATTISFDPTDDINDSAEGMSYIGAYEMINVSGSAESGNNRYYFTKSNVGADHITVRPATVATSAAGSSVTIEQGHSIKLDGTLTEEFPGNSVTVSALGLVLAQSFTLPVDDSFTVGEIYIRAKRVGNPADSLKVGLRADSSGSPSATDLETTTVVGSDLSTEMTWVRFVMDGTTDLSYGSTYWLLVSRTSSYSHENYYAVDLNSAYAYTGGELKMWDGSGWVTRPATDEVTALDMPFQIWSQQQTSVQMTDMLSAGDQFFADFEVQDASGIYKRQYRDQDLSCQVEIENLMRSGLSTGKRYLARVTPDRVAQLYEEPDSGDNDAMLHFDGSLTDASGQPLESGRLPAGEWVQLVGTPTNVDEVEKLSPLFVERAEWDCEQDELTALEFKGAPNPWEMTF